MRNTKGQFIKGNIPFDRTGILHTEETKNKLKEKRKGRKPSLGMVHTDEFKIKQSKRLKEQWALGIRKPTNIGRKISKKEKKLLSKVKRGNKNPAWIDGRSKLTNQIRRCLKYRQWRLDVFTRDDFTCQVCNIRGCYLEAHHIKAFSIIFQKNKIKTIKEAFDCKELWNINNGKTLCYKCHNKTKDNHEKIC